MSNQAIKNAFQKVKSDIDSLNTNLELVSKQFKDSNKESLNSKLFKELQNDLDNLRKEIERVDKKTQVSFEDFANHMTEKIQLEISQLRLEMTDHLIQLENRTNSRNKSNDDLLY